MKILFDHQKFSMQQFGGISRYFANLHRGINQQSGCSAKISALYSENEYLPKELLPLNNAFGKFFFHEHKNRTYRWNRRYSEWQIARGNFDLFHPTYYDPYFLETLKKPFILTVHDMVHESHPQLFKDSDVIQQQKKKLINRAAGIIAISEYTKSQLLNFYPHSENKVSVIHHGIDLTNHLPVQERPELPGRYLLFVGERWHYKNFNNFIEAVSPLLIDDKSLHLICTGGGNFSPSELQFLSDRKISDKVIQIQADENLLNALYQNALAFIFPSRDEGFGLPMLEAFRNNCPLACSKTGSLPEVGGNAACYFDPHDISNIREVISELIYDQKLVEVKKKAGTDRLLNFDFQHCLQKTLKVYEQFA